LFNSRINKEPGSRAGYDLASWPGLAHRASSTLERIKNKCNLILKGEKVLCRISSGSGEPVKDVCQGLRPGPWRTWIEVNSRVWSLEVNLRQNILDEDY
jgi:hypothetical protein